MEHAFLADHRVLASVSRGYPRLAGSLITCYSPVRHATHLAAFTFDLHASSTPPTFVLSQDQTLHLIGCVLGVAPDQATAHAVHQVRSACCLPAALAAGRSLKKAHTLFLSRPPGMSKIASRTLVAGLRGAGEGSVRSKPVKRPLKFFAAWRAQAGGARVLASTLRCT
jgi:hypothetical protein